MWAFSGRQCVIIYRSLPATDDSVAEEPPDELRIFVENPLEIGPYIHNKNISLTYRAMIRHIAPMHTYCGKSRCEVCESDNDLVMGGRVEQNGEV